MASRHHTGPSRTSAAPLTAAEISMLWRTERKAMRLYVFAVTVLAAGLALPHIYAQGPGLTYVVLLLALLLIGAALLIQMRVRCPRCDARLATQSLLLLPERCKSCGVAIAHPSNLDGELDA